MLPLLGLAVAPLLPGVIPRGRPVVVLALLGVIPRRLLVIRTLLSALTVTNDHASVPGSLAQEVALASSGATIKFAPALAGETIHLSSPLNFNGNLNLDGSRAGGLTIVDTSGVAINDVGGNLTVNDMSIVGAIHVVNGNAEAAWKGSISNLRAQSDLILQARASSRSNPESSG